MFHLLGTGFVDTGVKDKIKANSIPAAQDATWQQLYGPLMAADARKLEELFAMAESTVVTDEAILHAALSPRPQTRYFVSNVGGVPAIVLAFLARVLPTSLVSWIEGAF
jgi:hypothetical protein